MKKLSYDDMEFWCEWTCPYKKCGKLNRDWAEGMEELGITINCSHCKKEVKILSPKVSDTVYLCGNCQMAIDPHIEKPIDTPEEKNCYQS